MGLLLAAPRWSPWYRWAFAWLADKALEWNRAWVGHSGWRC